LKWEFAEAYFYGDRPNGCASLQHGYRCRAMASRKAAGAAFFQELIDSTPKNKTDRMMIGSLQLNYARMRYEDSIPTYDPESGGLPGCRALCRQSTREREDMCPNVFGQDGLFGALPAKGQRSGDWLLQAGLRLPTRLSTLRRRILNGIESDRHESSGY
jgi:hypothetical protein